MKQFVVVLLFLGFTACDEKNKLSENNPTSFTVLEEVLDHLQNNFSGQLSPNLVTDIFLSSFLNTIDPYGIYYTKEDFLVLNMLNKGEFGGIGVEVVPSKFGLKIVSSLNNTPAQKSGLQSGEFITAINDEKISQKNLNQSIVQLQGPSGTSVKLHILRENGTTRIAHIMRENILINPILFYLEKNIGYLRISTFDENCYKDILLAVERSIIERKIKALIVDLRNNPGGLLSEAVKATDLFLDEGPIVFISERSNAESVMYSATKTNYFKNIPIVVLINGGTASGGEIMAAAFKDHQRAILVGTRTFGKGSIQTIYPLTNGGAVKFTTAQFFSAKHKAIQNVGVDPDFLVEMSKDDILFEKEKDSQLRYAHQLIYNTMTEQENRK